MTLGLDDRILTMSKSELPLNGNDNILPGREFAGVVQVDVATLELRGTHLTHIGSIIRHRTKNIEHTVVAVDDHEKKGFGMKMIARHSILCLVHR